MLERMEIAGSIYKDVVEPFIKTTRSDDNCDDDTSLKI